MGSDFTSLSFNVPLFKMGDKPHHLRTAQALQRERIKSMLSGLPGLDAGPSHPGQEALPSGPPFCPQPHAPISPSSMATHPLGGGRWAAAGSRLLTLVQDSVGRLVPGQGLLGQVLVALGKALHLGQAGVEGHGGMVGVLGHVEVRGPPELLLDDQCLLQQLGGGEQGPLSGGPFATSTAPRPRLWAERREGRHTPTQQSILI